MGNAIRKYQSRDKENIIEGFNKYRSIVFQCPTGGGKSVVSTDLADIWVTDGANILVMAHRRELLKQFNEHFTKRKIEVGMLAGKMEKNMDAKVVIASVHTATRDNRLETLLKRKWDYIIVDECHRIMSESYIKPIREIRNTNSDCKLLGLTATPYRLDKKDLSEQFDIMICSDDISTLIQNGYLANYKTYATPVREIDEVDKTSNGSDYKQESLSNYMRNEKQIEYLVESYKEYGAGKQMIVYCVDRKHARDVEKAYLAGGYKSVDYIDGNTKEADRDKIISDFENGLLQIIVSIDTLTEGVDLPETGCIQLARPTLSLSLYLQMVGRGLRPKKDGSALIILDNSGCSNTFGLISSPKRWSLDPKSNPNEPREGNKVVAKRKNGTYETDLDNAEFLELEEMTHDEYVEKVLNNEEDAIKYNDESEEKIMGLLMNLSNEILVASGNKNFEIIRKKNYGRDNITASCKDDKSINIEFKIDISKARIDFISNIYYFHNAEYKKLTTAVVAVAAFYKSMDDNKNLQILVKTKMALIALIEMKKIDLNKLKTNIRTAKEEALTHRFEKYLSSNNKVIFKPNNKEGEPIERKHYKSLAQVFSSCSGWYGHDRIASMVFEKNVLLSKNMICIYDEKDVLVYESKSVKKEKIIEILKFCNPILD